MTSPDDKTPDGLEPAAVPAVKDDGEVVLPDAGETLPESPESESDDKSDAVEDAAEDKKAGRMSLMDHLLELRKRLTRCLLAVLVGFLACYGFAQRMFEILMEPMRQALTKIHETTHVLSPDFFDQLKPALTEALKGQNFPYLDQIAPFVDALKEATVKVVVEQGHFIYTYPPEAFFAYVKVAFVAGFFLVSPFVFYELWGFVAPGLYEHERKWMIPVAVLSALFFVSGSLFGYFVVFPFGFEFFASYANEAISFMPKLSEYLSFALKLLFAFGLIFEMPLFVFFLSRFGLVTSKMLRKQRKYAILVAFIVAAILTPPDPFTQTLMAGPLCILYEISIWVAFFFGKEKTRREEEAAAAAEAEETPADGPADDGGAGA